MRDDVGSLQALRPFSNFETDFLSLVEGLVALDLDLGEVDKEIFAVFPLDKAVTLLVTEPFYGSICQPSTLPSACPYSRRSSCTFLTARELMTASSRPDTGKQYYNIKGL